MLSANTLFHFTKDVNVLSKILINGFRPSYCKEDFSFLKDNTIFNCYYVPMVCFCDIPLSQIKNHSDKFGKYGLGMSIDWTIKNGISPVSYVSAGTSDIYYALAGLEGLFLISSIDKGSSIDPLEQMAAANVLTGYVYSIIRVLGYIKSYKNIDRASGLITKYYDEKEWRYLAGFSPFPDRNPHYLRIPDFATIVKNEMFEIYDSIYQGLYNLTPIDALNLGRECISDKYLKFELSDLKYIIVRHENDIFGLRNVLMSNDRFSNTDIEKIISRTITYNQIRDDF
ncbi:abortive infection system antitoxin AbiGi family protein [Emticicia sp. BO119]|uniref:abortive infection system antitoxin AbiGi family protein n=1 Tax=Emticicia sp. BO119 TaxID=2757768 RepID=UPI0015F061FF|nr:abortive infection system antitoxin AbiGi family protein [Emticicia sp. BO119]MBA4852933.1 hypothetical protein [Emticicia sp. BO119]